MALQVTTAMHPPHLEHGRAGPACKSIFVSNMHPETTERILSAFLGDSAQIQCIFMGMFVPSCSPGAALRCSLQIANADECCTCEYHREPVALQHVESK